MLAKMSNACWKHLEASRSYSMALPRDTTLCLTLYILRSMWCRTLTYTLSKWVVYYTTSPYWGLWCWAVHEILIQARFIIPIKGVRPFDVLIGILIVGARDICPIGSSTRVPQQANWWRQYDQERSELSSHSLLWHNFALLGHTYIRKECSA